jgi:D-alanyl-D-alanine-carboxypeptidase/D-alanyl-D-alanine-endopeptidase
MNRIRNIRHNLLLSGLSALIVASLASIPGAPAAAPAKKPSPPLRLVAPPGAGVFAGPSDLPSDTDIQRMVDDRVVTFHDSVGLIVGVIEPAGRRLFARGPAQVGNDDTVDGDTIFEIGSVSKVFTALALADEAHRGELSLSDPAAKYLPPETTFPQRGPKPITLVDLGTHMSGLPNMPPNVVVTDFNNPNADMTQDQFLKSVAAYELTRDIGAGYQYSNAGYQLLGLAVANAAHTDFETLLKSRIFGPLKMDNTRIAASLDEKDRMSAGYDSHLQPVPHERMPTLLGSGGIRSTANDLLNFVAANIGLTASSLAPAMADMVKTQRPTQYLELKAALGWHVATLHGVEMVWENGQTAGYRAFIGFVPKTRSGVVVLSNSANTIDDIGVHILDKASPLRTLHREAEIKTSQFDNYIGRYVVSDTFALNVTRDGNKLYIQGTGQPRAELYSSGDDQFFLRVVNGTVIFQTDGSGRARSLSLTQDGKTVPAQLVQ